jgi:hypothetical protein
VLHRGQQVQRGHAAQVELGFHLGRRRQAQIGAQAGFLPLAQGAGNLLVALIGNQQPRQLVARVFLARLALHRPRQQRLALDQDQSGGDHQEVGDVAQVHRLQHLEIGQELIGYLSQRHAGDIQLVALDELEQQVERAGIDRQLHGVVIGRQGHSVLVDGE